jgi:hypothetical protein
MQRRGDVPVLNILKQYNGIKYDSEKEDVSEDFMVLYDNILTMLCYI